jgi:hypothetical protein
MKNYKGITLKGYRLNEIKGYKAYFKVTNEELTLADKLLHDDKSIKVQNERKKVTKGRNKQVKEKVVPFIPIKRDIIKPNNLTLATVLQEYDLLKELGKDVKQEELNKYSIPAMAMVKCKGYLMYKEESLKAWNTVIKNNYDDFKQEIELALVIGITRIFTKIEEGKLSLNRISDEKQYKVTFEHVSELTFKELFMLIYRDLKRDVLTWLGKQSSESNLSLADTLHQSSLWIDEYGDTALSLLEQIEDKSALLQLEVGAYIDNIQGTLTAGEYQFLTHWLKEGKKPYDNSKTQLKITKKLKNLNLTEDEMKNTFNDLVYRERLKEEQLLIKMRRLTMV